MTATATDKGKPVARPRRKATGLRNPHRRQRCGQPRQPGRRKVKESSLLVLRCRNRKLFHHLRSGAACAGAHTSFAIDKGIPIRKGGTQSHRASAHNEPLAAWLPNCDDYEGEKHESRLHYRVTRSGVPASCMADRVGCSRHDLGRPCKRDMGQLALCVRGGATRCSIALGDPTGSRLTADTSSVSISTTAESHHSRRIETPTILLTISAYGNCIQQIGEKTCLRLRRKHAACLGR